MKIKYLSKVWLFLFVLIVACSSNKSVNPLVGKWEIVNATGSLAEMNVGTIYKFGDVSEFITEKGGFKNQGTYIVSGDTICSIFGTVTITALFRIEGTKMNYEILNSDQKFELSKK